jgi:hypothetical protein
MLRTLINFLWPETAFNPHLLRRSPIPDQQMIITSEGIWFLSGAHQTLIRADASVARIQSQPELPLTADVAAIGSSMTLLAERVRQAA